MASDFRRSPTDSVVVGVIEQGVDPLCIVSLAQLSSERVLREVLEDDLHCLQMLFGSALWAEQQEDGVYGLLIEGVEIDSALRNTDRRGHLLDFRVLDMRNGNTATEAGRVLAFALEHLVEQVVANLAWRCSGLCDVCFF